MYIRCEREKILIFLKSVCAIFISCLQPIKHLNDSISLAASLFRPTVIENNQNCLIKVEIGLNSSAAAHVVNWLLKRNFIVTLDSSREVK